LTALVENVILKGSVGMEVEVFLFHEDVDELLYVLKGVDGDVHSGVV